MEPIASRRDPNASKPASQTTSWELYKRAIYLAVGIVVFLLIFASFISVTFPILLLLFLCILMAIGVRGMSDWLAHHTPLSDNLALAVVGIAFLTLCIGAGLLIGPRFADQLSQLSAAVPEAVRQVEVQISQYSWGQQLIAEIPSASQLKQQVLMGGSTDIFARITGVVSSALGFLSSVVVVLFITLYLALEPKSYVDNFLRLIPLNKRNRVRDTLQAIHVALRKWLLTRLISMVLIGVVTFVGLSLIGMPLTLSLAIIAALGAFIPTFGPIIALVPAVLVALLQDPQPVVLVLMLYLGTQGVDNYLVTPYIQKSLLYLPPVYIIVAQLLFGVVAGAFGLVLAAPLATALVIIVRMLYVEDVLGDHVQESHG